MKNSRQSWAPVLVASVVLASATGANAAEPGSVTLTLRVRDRDTARVPRAVLQRAERELTAIYRRIGVNAVWTDRFPLGARPATEGAARHECSLQLVVLIPSTEEIRHIEHDADALGFAPRVTAAQAERWVFLLYDRIQRLAESQKLDLSMLVAHVLAHEIGHQLLPDSSHSASGIMRGQWDTVQLHAAARGALAFDEDQAEQIRATVSAAAVRSR
jgi:hypothetical protein